MSTDEEWAKLGRIMHEDMRAALTRALTAQAWMVACRLFDPMWRPDSIDPEQGEEDWGGEWVENVAFLPSPADLAAEILGDG